MDKFQAILVMLNNVIPNVVDIAAVAMALMSAKFFNSFIQSYLVYSNAVSARNAYVIANSLQAHGYTSPADLHKLKELTDGVQLAPSVVKWGTVTFSTAISSIILAIL